MREAATWSDRDLLTEYIFSQAPNKIQFRLLRILDVFGTSAVSETDATPEFHMLGDDPAFSEKSGWSAVTTEPFFRPTTYEPITRNDQTLTPMSSTRTSDKAGDFRGSLAQPSVRYLMSQTHLLVLLIFIHVFFVFI